MLNFPINPRPIRCLVRLQQCDEVVVDVSKQPFLTHSYVGRWSFGDNHLRPSGLYQDRNHSTMAKMQHQYWVTKETVFRKLGKKEDENIVASDAELDAKLELFKSIQDSCMDLQRIIDRYQERICLLAQEENGTGRFLKEAGKQDKTGAGNVMITLGKTMSYLGQQRISLRAPLMRLFQEVETFRHRAIEDTGRTVNSMEKSRTEYRASLSWMKDVSQELDPDTYKQLEKFRKVQETVKQTKAVFDRYKLDCLQKVDLLAAARCNMFSHALILYHNVMLQFATTASTSFHSIATSCQDHRKFEFSVVKELSEMKPEPTEETAGEAAEDTDEKLLNFEDVADEPELPQNVDPIHSLDFLAEPPKSTQQFLPSQLLLQNSDVGTLISVDEPAPPTQEPIREKPAPSAKSWLDLFSELDPLSNPDTVGQPTTSEPLRNC